MTMLQLVAFDLDYTIWQPEMYQIDGPPKLTIVNTSNCDDDDDNNDTNTETTNKKSRRNNRRRRNRNKQQQQNTITTNNNKYSNELIQQSQSIQTNCIVTDQNEIPITIFDGATYALHQLHSLNNTTGSDDDDNNNNSNGSNVQIQIAVASKTDEPEWAHQCMQWLVIPAIVVGGGGGSESDDDHITTTTKSPIPLSQLINHIEIHVTNKQVHFRNLHLKTRIPYEHMLFFDNEYGNIQDVKRLGVVCVYTPEGMTRDKWEEGLALFGM